MNALAIDPGLTTGMAFKTTNGYHTLWVNRTDVHEIYKFILEHDYQWVAVEQFQTANVISRYGLRTTELVGAIEVLCWLRRIPCVRRTPQSRIPLMHRATDIAHSQGVKVDHQIDALAHLLSVERDIESGKVILAAQNLRSVIVA